MSYVFDTPASARTVQRPSRTTLLRAALAAGGAVALLVAFALSAAPAPARDADLARLLLLMAGIKGAIAVGAFALLAWRFGHALATPVALACVASAALLAGGSLAIALGVHVGAGALAFHAGALLLLGAAWRDRQG